MASVGKSWLLKVQPRLGSDEPAAHAAACSPVLGRALAAIYDAKLGSSAIFLSVTLSWYIRHATSQYIKQRGQRRRQSSSASDTA